MIKTTAARRCATAITIDVNTNTVYWLNMCLFRLESVRVSGRHVSEVSQVRLAVQLPRGMSVFEGFVYLIVSGGNNYYISRYNVTTGEATQVTSTLTEMHGVEIVHPKRQPYQSEWLP